MKKLISENNPDVGTMHRLSSSANENTAQMLLFLAGRARRPRRAVIALEGELTTKDGWKAGNHTFRALMPTKECVVAIPSAVMSETVVRIRSNDIPVVVRKESP